MNLKHRARELAWDVVNENRELFDSITKERAVDILSQALLNFTADLMGEVERLNKQLGSPYDLNEAALKRVAELESKLCGMREAIKILYKLHQSNRPDLLFPVRAKIVFGMEKIFQQALSSTPTCKHKGEQQVNVP